MAEIQLVLVKTPNLQRFSPGMWDGLTLLLRASLRGEPGCWGRQTWKKEEGEMCVPLSDIPKARCLLAGAAERAQPVPKIGPIALAERGRDGAARPMGTSLLPEQPHPVPASRLRVSERFSNPNPKSDGIGAFCSMIFSKESCWLQLGPGGPRGFLFSGISVPWSRVSVGGHIQDVSLLPCLYGASWLRAGTGRGLLAPGTPQRGAEGHRGALTPHGCTGDGLERDEGCCRAPKHGREVMR